MPTKQIGNPGGVWGQTGDPQGQVIADCVNNSGGSLAVGDLVICTDVAGILVTTTTAANSKRVIGVVGESDSIGTQLGAATSGSTYAAGDVMPVIVLGPARINIGANTIVISDILCSSGTAKVAIANNAATVAQAIAIALEADSAKDANNTIRAYIAKM